MPSLISVGCSSETTREMIGRSCSARPRPWPNCRPKAAISSGKPNSCAFGHTLQTLSVLDARLDQRDRVVEPFARLLVGVVLHRRGAADIEGAVVAGAVAHERLQDVEERLIARPHHAVGEIVRMRVAALARNGVDRLDVVGAVAVEKLVHLGDDVVLAHAGLELLVDQMIGAVDHRGGAIEQRDLVG